jgi:hypothetical protein
MDGIKCFFLEPTIEFQRFLRRFTWNGTGLGCPGGGHNIMYATEDIVQLPKFPDDGFRDDEWDHADTRWPRVCTCGYEFQLEDQWQHIVSRLFRRQDTGEKMIWRDAPVGAMCYHDSWNRRGFDGHSLAVKLPGDHVWWPDEQSSNCTRKDDKEHYCWCRHGQVPVVTIDKTPEPGHETCSAGGGSIATRTWHGFLRAGLLITA